MISPSFKFSKSGVENPFYGKCHSLETRLKISKTKQGCVAWNKGLETSKKTRLKISSSLKGRMAWNKGKKLPTGENSNRWIKDRTLIKGRHNRNMHDPEYKRWRKMVWDRDYYKCKVDNNDCAGKIEAHHIIAWRESVDLRYEVNNGITLCHFHHPRKRNDEAKLIPIFNSMVLKEKILSL